MYSPFRHIVITHKATVLNGGGMKVDDRLIGPEGTWSIYEAGRLILLGQALFYYDGQCHFALNELPEQTPF